MFSSRNHLKDTSKNHDPDVPALPSIPQNTPSISSFLFLIRGAAFQERTRQLCIERFTYNASLVEVEIKEKLRELGSIRTNMQAVADSYHNESAEVKDYLGSKMTDLDKDRKAVKTRIDRLMFSKTYYRDFVRLFENIAPLPSVPLPKMSGVLSVARWFSAKAQRENIEMQMYQNAIEDLSIEGPERDMSQIHTNVQDLLAEFTRPEHTQQLTIEKLDAIEARLNKKVS